MEPGMVAILICAIAVGVIAIIMVRLLIGLENTRYDIDRLRSYITEIKRDLFRDHNLIQNAIEEAERRLDILTLVMPVGDQVVESVKKMYDKVDEED